jgi:hypothetical protein
LVKLLLAVFTSVTVVPTAAQTASAEDLVLTDPDTIAQDGGNLRGNPRWIDAPGSGVRAIHFTNQSFLHVPAARHLDPKQVTISKPRAGSFSGPGRNRINRYPSMMDGSGSPVG